FQGCPARRFTTYHLPFTIYHLPFTSSTQLPNPMLVPMLHHARNESKNIQTITIEIDHRRKLLSNSPTGQERSAIVNEVSQERSIDGQCLPRIRARMTNQ